MSTLEKLEPKRMQKDECCPTFHPEKWEDKLFSWNQKKFIKESIPEFFHIPYPPMIGKKIGKMTKLAEESHKLSENKEDILLLFMDPSPFKAELYLSVTDEVPNANNVTISGTFISKVFDGEYREVPQFIKQMKTYLKEQNKTADDFYVHYAYCPGCAKERGHNYMVLFAKIVD